MKTKLVLIAVVFAVLVSSAQTNIIIFPQLLSPTNSVLMTNAEFHAIIGNRIFFGSGSDIRSFHAGDLNTNVLAAIHVTADQLDSKQAALDAANQKYWQKFQIDAAAQKAAEGKQEKLGIARDITKQDYVLSWKMNHGGQLPPADQVEFVIKSEMTVIQNLADKHTMAELEHNMAELKQRMAEAEQNLPSK